jgi:hydrogenase/urease accessory protein HupE
VIRLDPPLTRTEWAIIALASIAGLIAGYAYGSAVFAA